MRCLIIQIKISNLRRFNVSIARYDTYSNKDAGDKCGLNVVQETFRIFLNHMEIIDTSTNEKTKNAV